jgi:hypothetical protein
MPMAQAKVLRYTKGAPQVITALCKPDAATTAEDRQDRS